VELASLPRHQKRKAAKAAPKDEPTGGAKSEELGGRSPADVGAEKRAWRGRREDAKTESGENAAVPKTEQIKDAGRLAKRAYLERT
jgi:hypothetical protein